MPKRTDSLAYQFTVDVDEIRAESEALFRSIGDGAIATDQFGHITRINPTALTILGLTARAAIGEWYPRVVPLVTADNKPVPLIERPIVRMFLSGRSVSEKVWYRGKDSQLIPISVTVSPIILANKPVGAIEVFRDITAESEVDRLKTEFISLASHQLRTPLSTIKTYAHMLADGYMGKTTASQTAGVRTILAATNNMNELIDALLNVARIESGNLQVTDKAIDLAQLLREVVEQFVVSAKTKTVRLTFELPKQPIVLKTDGLIVREVLTNLIGNAVKYTPPYGSILIRIQDRAHDVLFTVQDTGIGIPELSQSMIFSKFFRAQNVLRQETTGTGLGLYLVKGLLTSLHGSVWFKSKEDKGSSFYVSLPKLSGRRRKN